MSLLTPGIGVLRRVIDYKRVIADGWKSQVIMFRQIVKEIIMYDICKNYKKAQMMRNVSSAALHWIYKVASNSRTYKIEWFLKGAWGRATKTKLVSVTVGVFVKFDMSSVYLSIYLFIRHTKKPRHLTNMIPFPLLSPSLLIFPLFSLRAVSLLLRCPLHSVSKPKPSAVDSHLW